MLPQILQLVNCQFLLQNKFVKSLILILFFSSLTFATTPKEVLKELQKGDFQKAEQLYSQLSTSQKSTELGTWANYLFETNGQKAEQTLQEFVKKFPTSKKIQKARFELISVYFLKEDTKRFQKETDTFLRKYPNSKYRKRLKRLQRNIFTPTQIKRSKEKPTKFFVQVGAFSNPTNAQLLKEKLEKRNYGVILNQKVRNDQTLHLVWVKTEANKSEEATQTGEELQNRFTEIGSFSVIPAN
ncbi:MAG: outer membrane protein assembly factor BamD [Calditrichaeota bacterium]|nr:MAG: outer membrane protein assembly factor BamD [Calditrichota bacterium]